MRTSFNPNDDCPDMSMLLSFKFPVQACANVILSSSQSCGVPMPFNGDIQSGVYYACAVTSSEVLRLTGQMIW